MWGAVISLGATGLLVLASRLERGTRRARGVESAAAGALPGWVNEDMQKAVEIIAEGRAEARDAERRDGNCRVSPDPVAERLRDVAALI